MSVRLDVARHLCGAAQDNWAVGKAYWLSLADQVLSIALRDRDAAPREREAVEAEGQQPDPKGIAK